MQDAGAVIDLLAPDVAEIINTHGMVCQGQAQPSRTPLFAPFARSLRLFPVDPRDVVDLVDLGARLHLEQQKTVGKIARASRSHARGSVLIDGWHYPERDNAGTARWSAGMASLQAGQKVRQIRLCGHVPTERILTVLVEGQQVLAERLSGLFWLERHIDAMAGDLIEFSLTSATVRIGNDIRELGMRLSEISLHDGSDWHRVDLDRTLSEQVALEDLDGFMSLSAGIAAQRPAALNADYLAARGLRSRAALEHIRKVAAGYDHVLVHGIQFAFVHDVAMLLNEIGKPFTLIPHMHLDDGFYHWQPQYDCVAAASAVIVPENDHYRRFLSRFQTRIHAAPGGGYEPSEFRTPGSERQKALERHGLSGRDYFLVLGRKSPAKHYRTAMEAFARADLKDRAELIIVGPDEDGQPVVQEGVRYLGALPRTEVIALVQGCTALVSMSESESFGIVLVEAWVAGKPVIAYSGCAVYRELVDEGQDGHLVANPVELAERMTALLADPALRDRLGAEGRKKAEARFTWKQVAARIMEGLA